MKVCELKEKFGFAELNIEDGQREINGVYCGDLLSWVMGYGEYSQAWFTIMGNINAVAVCALHDMGCMVLCQNSTMQPNALEKAKEEGIWVFSTNLTMFEASGRYFEAIK